MSTDGVLGAAYLPTDGYIDPSQLTFALAEGARRRGAEVEHVHAGHRDPRRARARRPAVETDQGEIETEIVVNAGGMYAREIGRTRRRERPDRADGARVPRARSPTGLPLDMPTMRDPSLLVYFRPESGGLIMGGYERDLRAVVARRDPAPTSTASCSRRTGRASRS